MKITRGISRFAASLLLVTAALVGWAAPAAATDTFTTESFINPVDASAPIPFNALVNNRWECLSVPGGVKGAQGNAAKQVTVWGCGANTSLQSWTIHWTDCWPIPGPAVIVTCDAFYLWNATSQGCLDDWNGLQINGSPVKLYGPELEAGACAFDGNSAEQVWSLWHNSTGYYLGPWNEGVWSGQVASINGVPQDGSTVHMWNYTASPKQKLIAFDTIPLPTS